MQSTLVVKGNLTIKRIDYYTLYALKIQRWWRKIKNYKKECKDEYEKLEFKECEYKCQNECECEKCNCDIRKYKCNYTKYFKEMLYSLLEVSVIILIPFYIYVYIK